MGEWRMENREWGRRGVVLVLVGCLVLALAVPVLAQVSSNYDLSWGVVAGGSGRMASAGGHAVLGSAGQPLAGPMVAGGGHTLCSGFWCGAAARYRVYLPLVARNL
jgi:hypothetical protein